MQHVSYTAIAVVVKHDLHSDIYLLPYIYNAVIAFGYRDNLVFVEEGKGIISLTAVKNGMTSQIFNFTASTRTYTEIESHLSSDFLHSNSSEADTAIRMSNL